jgi:hypothetical protein
MDYELDGPGSISGKGQEIFLFSAASRPTLGSTQPPIPWIIGTFFLGVKRTGREVDDSPPSSVEVKNGGAIHPLHKKCSRHGAYFIKHRDNLIFYLYNYSKIATS